MAAAFAHELQCSLKWRAKSLLGLGTLQEAFAGLVVAVQRSDSALRLNGHLHVLAPDGVYVRHGPDLDPPVAEVRGISIYAKQAVDGRNRPQLERLCRTITRPPIAQDRLEVRPDGRTLPTFKWVWKDGPWGLAFEPQDLITSTGAETATRPVEVTADSLFSCSPGA